MSSNDPFKFFLQSWLDELNTMVTRLESVPLVSVQEAEHRDLISAFMAHQESLLSAKRALVCHDPFLGVCLPWINSLSRALIWFGGWRPVVAYHITEVSRVVPEEQNIVRLTAMRLVTNVEEVAIEKEKSRTEDRVIKALLNGRGISSTETAFKATMERVALAADMSRMEAVKRVIDILSPTNAVVYLAKLGKMEANFYEIDEVEVEVEV